MTREWLIKYWPIIEAFKNGETIQVKIDEQHDWEDTLDPLFRVHSEYRVKPKEMWIVTAQTGERRWSHYFIFDSQKEAIKYAKENYCNSGHALVHKLSE